MLQAAYEIDWNWLKLMEDVEKKRIETRRHYQWKSQIHVVLKSKLTG